jgi:hypothetical protein
MTLRNEIFEGLTAAKMGRDLVWDPQRNYAEEMYKIARRENDDYDERKRAREQAIAAGVPGQQGTATAIPVPVMASTAMPGTPAGALNTGVNPGIMRLPSSRMPRNPPGTIVDRWGYADGGMVLRDKQREHLTANTNMRSTVPDLPDDSMDGTHNEADGIVQELLAGAHAAGAGRHRRWSPASVRDVAAGARRGDVADPG